MPNGPSKKPKAVKGKQTSNICVAGSLDKTSISCPPDRRRHPTISLDLAKKALNCIHETMSKYYGQVAVDF